MANGNVIVFNGTTEQMNLIIDNAYMINKPVAGAASSNGWVPNSVSIARSSADNHAGDLEFSANTSLAVLLGTSGQSIGYTVQIPQRTNPLPDDVQLYVFYDRLVLVSASSTSEPKSTVLEGRPAPEAMAMFNKAQS